MIATGIATEKLTQRKRLTKREKKRLEDQEGTRKKKKHYFKLLFYGLGKLRGKKKAIDSLGNMGCQVFRRGIQNQIDIWL